MTCRVVECPECNGNREVGSGRMSNAVNTATIDEPWELPMTCPTCNGAGYVEGESYLIEEYELDEYAPPVNPTAPPGKQ